MRKLLLRASLKKTFVHLKKRRLRTSGASKQKREICSCHVSNPAWDGFWNNARSKKSVASLTKMLISNAIRTPMRHQSWTRNSQAGLVLAIG